MEPPPRVSRFGAVSAGRYRALISPPPSLYVASGYDIPLSQSWSLHRSARRNRTGAVVFPTFVR
ncbi:hypothetical protein [Streptomyces clavifer]|uniref:hypothetical protein n=1 Tax=Streptomyces clavifer TaxID=68188 RepID=UPI003087D860|nr:hypothetical protein OG388_23465 [Streptomyces clavifer]